MDAGLVPLLSLTPQEPFCECVVPGAASTSRMRNRKSPSFIPAGAAFILKLSVHREQITVAQPGTHGPPASKTLPTLHLLISPRHLPKVGRGEDAVSRMALTPSR